MYEPAGDLAAALARDSPAALVPDTSPLRADLAAAGDRYVRSLVVGVGGRPGVGRDTMARALRERLAVTAVGPGEDPDADADVDVWVYVLTGPARAADVAALHTLAADRTIVVLGKADTLDDADATVADVERSVGRPVLAVSALLACADLSDDELDFLRELVAAGVPMPSMAGAFLAGAPTGSRQRAYRLALLRRLDRRGIEIAMDLIADRDPVADAAATMNRELWAHSGIDAVVPAIAGHVDRVRYWRDVELRSRLDRAAARGPDRERVEELLRTPGGVG
ncbi:hypothetical protein GCM10009624_24750 [Gordonia sinesedis]